MSRRHERRRIGQALYDRHDVYDVLYANKDYESEVAFVLDRFGAHGNGGHRALVVGCDTGRHNALLEDRGFRVTGTDPSPAMLERARERSDATFLSGELPDVESSFDADSGIGPTPSSPSSGYRIPSATPSDQLAPALQSLTDRFDDGTVLLFDLGGFPEMSAPVLQAVPWADCDCARLYQYHHSDDRVRMDALVFFGSEWFVDTDSLTAFDAEAVADSLRELGHSVETHDWYGDAPTFMPDLAVIVAY